ncbi:hypothetical protein [Streptomyces lasiicapitis]
MIQAIYRSSSSRATIDVHGQILRLTVEACYMDAPYGTYADREGTP